MRSQRLVFLAAVSTAAISLLAVFAAQAAAPVITDTALVPRFTIQSDLGVTNQIQYSTSLSETNWVVLTNLVVTESPYWFVDVDAPTVPRRFYRVLALGTNSPAPPGMALIPAGSFVMGNCMDPGEGSSNELPLHTVNVSAFYMDKNLVSYTLWSDVYQWAVAHGYAFDSGGSAKAANHPVHSIYWNDCVKWCNARSEKEGRVPAYYTDAGLSVRYRTGQLVALYVNWSSGYRLPTEAEWEKAARGGASGHRFPWSDADTINWSRANYYASPGSLSYDVNAASGYDPAWTSGGDPYTAAVGTFAANGYGLYDMAGNVCQWCWDWYDGSYYGSSSPTDPRGPTSGRRRVLRGGDGAYSCRSAYRYYNGPAIHDSHEGFRCARAPGQ